MKPLFVLAPALAFLAASVASAVGLQRPTLRPRTVTDPVASQEAAVLRDLEHTVANFFALQSFYLKVTDPKRKNEAGDYDHAVWATQRIQEESAAFDRLNGAVDNIIGRMYRTRDIPPRTAYLSYAVYTGNSPEDDRTWDLARRRANLGSALVAYYYTTRSSRASNEDAALAREDVKKAKEELAALTARK